MQAVYKTPAALSSQERLKYFQISSPKHFCKTPIKTPKKATSRLVLVISYSYYFAEHPEKKAIRNLLLPAQANKVIRNLSLTTVVYIK